MKLCKLFPQMKRMIKLPYDAALLKKMNKCIVTLKNDHDKDVAHFAQMISDQMYIIETTGLESEDDLRDRKKEEEEEEMLRAEQREADEVKKKEEEARNEF